MTIDRAIEILDPDHRETYDSIEPINEACRIAVDALKTQKSCMDVQMYGGHIVATGPMKNEEVYTTICELLIKNGVLVITTNDVNFPGISPSLSWFLKGVRMYG